MLSVITTLSTLLVHAVKMVKLQLFNVYTFNDTLQGIFFVYYIAFLGLILNKSALFLESHVKPIFINKPESVINDVRLEKEGKMAIKRLLVGMKIFKIVYNQQRIVFIVSIMSVFILFASIISRVDEKNFDVSMFLFTCYLGVIIFLPDIVTTKVRSEFKTKEILNPKHYVDMSKMSSRFCSKIKLSLE